LWLPVLILLLRQLWFHGVLVCGGGVVDAFALFGLLDEAWVALEPQLPKSQL
jgi:hypothetical protein